MNWFPSPLHRVFYWFLTSSTDFYHSVQFYIGLTYIYIFLKISLHKLYYKKFYIHTSPISNMVNTCKNCGIELYPLEELDKCIHDVQLEHQYGESYYCESCRFEDKYSGVAIVTAAQVELTDEELCDKLCEIMNASELRQWMSKRGFKRSRGDSKKRSAMKAIESDRLRVILELDSKLRVVPKAHRVMCQCGLDKPFMDLDKAIEYAKDHKDLRHTPKVWKNGGDACVFGR